MGCAVKPGTEPNAEPENPTMPAVAYSYMRFSSSEQAKGDSIRRQTANRDQWLAAHPDVTFDDSLKPDAGRSAFKRDAGSFATYALGGFVEMVKGGKVAAGSYLLVEGLDRISREDVGTATELLLSIVNRGVVVVQLFPQVREFRKPVDLPTLMYAVMELSTAHQESAMKSKRMKEVWGKKLSGAASAVVTKMLPGWIRHEGGKLVRDPAKVKTVRRIYALALQGHGAAGIAKMLNEEGAPVLGRATFKGRPVKWGNTTVYYILTTPAAMGTYVPRRATRPKDQQGEPVPGYFPAAVDADTFNAVQLALKTRATNGRGRRGKHVNLFAGLLKDARDGGSIGYHRRADYTDLTPIDVRRGRETHRGSFPAVPFDCALLYLLREVKPSDLDEGKPATSDADRDIAAVDAALAAWSGRMGNLAIIDKVEAELTRLTNQRRALVAKREKQRQEDAHPLPAAWGDALTLLDVLAKRNDTDTRTRLRAELRRAIESVTCMFAGRGRLRVAAVRVQFRDATHRNYIISYDPARSNADVKRAGVCRAASIAELKAPGQIDLRVPEDARAFVMWLETGDTNMALIRKGQTPAALLAKLDRTPPIPLD